MNDIGREMEEDFHQKLSKNYDYFVDIVRKYRAKQTELASLLKSNEKDDDRITQVKKEIVILGKKIDQFLSKN